VRTDAGAVAVLKMPDGARVEMHSGSEVSLEPAQDGALIRLRDGSVRVTPAPKPSLSLYVQNKDVTVPVLSAMVQSVAVAPPQASTAPTTSTVPKWEVVSIKPCDKGSGPPVPGARGSGGGPGENFTVSPGRFGAECMRLGVLMSLAYVRNGEPLL